MKTECHTALRQTGSTLEFKKVTGVQQPLVFNVSVEAAQTLVIGGEYGGPSLVHEAPHPEATCVNENRGQGPGARGTGPHTGMFTVYTVDLAAIYLQLVIELSILICSTPTS